MVNMIHEINDSSSKSFKSESDHLTFEILNRSEAILTQQLAPLNTVSTKEAQDQQDENLKRYIENQLRVKIESNEETDNCNDKQPNTTDKDR
jgi:hypothetical protein